MSKRVIRMLLAVLIEAVATAGLAQDLPASPACAEALDGLGKAEATFASAAAQGSERPDTWRPRAALARLQPFRDRAASACLGGRPMSPPPSQHLSRPPIRVAPIVIAPQVKAPVVPAPGVPAPKPPAPPLTLTICDAAGCLASDGSRLTRIGPALIGPRGLCIVQGIYVQCP